ncbi:MAG: lysine--tRNA ligase [Chlamydiota bacterium]
MKPAAPAYHSHETFRLRTEKLAAIRKLGIDPYPHHFDDLTTTKVLNDKYDGQAVGNSEEAAKRQTKPATVAGRLVLFRAMGKNAFAQLQDELGRIQVMFNREATTVTGLTDQAAMTPIKFIEKKLDLGDIIGIKGCLFRTQKGELTLFAHEVTLLAKALLPLPDKHSGLTDKGTRYRKRWLDLITHSEVGAQLKQRSFLISKIRRYFEEAHFIEVETPVLQNLYGGAEARPFTTELHALNQKMYLRIALEIALKKLIIGGMTRIFEIGKVFRNEGIDRTHNPEFTMLEAYAAYWDYNDVMVFVENLFAYLATELYGTTAIGIRHDKEGNPHPIDLKTPWKRMTMKAAIKTYGKIDSDALSTEEMRRKLEAETAVDPEAVKKAPRGKLIAYLFEEFAEHHLITPHHIIDHPIETTPLCKLHRDPKERAQNIVERFETFILGCEICNAYSELNDPELQRKLLQTQNKLRQQGDAEASPMDEEFIEAICQGMPPTGGFGIGIDRLVMLFNDAFSIRDVLYFPLMRPEE